MRLRQFLLERQMILSMAEGRRLLHFGVIRINGVVATDLDYEVGDGDEVRVGTRILD